MALATSTAALIAAGMSAAGAIGSAAMAGGGGSGMTWLPPPGKARKYLGEAHLREVRNVERSGALAKTNIAAGLASRGLGNTTVVQSKQDEVSRRTNEALADLSGRYNLAMLGGYQPAMQTGPDMTAFNGLMGQAGKYLVSAFTEQQPGQIPLSELGSTLAGGAASAWSGLSGPMSLAAAPLTAGASMFFPSANSLFAGLLGGGKK